MSVECKKDVRKKETAELRRMFKVLGEIARL